MCLSSISPLGQFQRTIYNIERPEGGTLEPWINGRGAKFERGTDLKGRTSELSSYHGNLKKFAPINYSIRWSLLFDSPGPGVYSSVSNLWDQIYLHLIFQLITHREICCLSFKCLTIVNCLFPFFSHCEEAVLCTKTLPKTTVVFRKKFIHKQDYLLLKKLFEYFSNAR